MREMHELLPDLVAKRTKQELLDEAVTYNAGRQLFIDQAMVLSIGKHRSIAGELLRLYGYSVYDITDSDNIADLVSTWPYRFEGILGTRITPSIIDTCCILLKPEGYCILTFDTKVDIQKVYDYPIIESTAYSLIFKGHTA
jgi:hypothetical protein